MAGQGAGVRADPVKVKLLVGMGFPEKAAAKALVASNNNTETAAAALVGSR